MVIKKIVIICLSLLGFWAVKTNAQSLFSADINAFAQEYVNKKKNKGLVVGLISNGTNEIKGFGQLSNNALHPPDENTIFELGSVTSVFTTSLMLIASQEGHFQLEDRIRDYLPSGVDAPAFKPFICREVEDYSHTAVDNVPRTRTICEPAPFAPEVCITFCNLASHTAALSDDPKGLYDWNPLYIGKQKKDPYKDYTKVELYEKLYRNDLNFAPGTHYKYSNSGIALLGNLVADIQQKDFSDLLEEKLLIPLQMDDTQITLRDDQLSRFAIGHTRKGKATNAWNFKAMAPAGGLKSTAKDLIRFIQANLTTDNTVLADAFEQVQQSRIDVYTRKKERPTTAGYGWFISTLNEATNQPVVWHHGGTGGFRVFVGFIKDTQTGVVILSNSANAVDEMGFDLLEQIISVTPVPAKPISSNN